MKQLLDNLKSMHEAAREEYEKSKKRPLGLDEHKVLQASWELLDETLCGAEKAVEKQIPKKPVIDPVDYAEVCPNCKSTGIREDYGAPNKYCADCGQAIDWGE